MQQKITLELAQQANALARAYHPGFYASLHTVVADLPATPEAAASSYFRRAAKVWFAEYPQVLQVVYAESNGDDDDLLSHLEQGLDEWAARREDPADSFAATEDQSTELLALVTHHLTSATERRELFGKLLGWHTRKAARELAADLAGKIEARSPGVLTGRGWMPHGEAQPQPSPHPFPTA
jgi:hypothetical protein